MADRRILSMLLLSLLLGGCHASPWATTKSDSPAANNAANASKNGSNAEDLKNPANKSTPTSSSEELAATATAIKSNPTDNSNQSPAANAQSLQEVMAEVRELGVLDPQSQDKLLEDLRQTDPALWPLMVRQVRAAVAYRRKSQDHGQTAAHSTILAAAPLYDSPPLPSTNYTDNAEIASQPIAPESDLGENIACNDDGLPGRLPSAARTAKSLPKNRVEEPRILEKPPSVAVTQFSPKQTGNSLKSAGTKVRDLQSLDVNSLDTKEEVTQASYEIPSGSTKRLKSAKSLKTGVLTSDAIDSPMVHSQAEEPSPNTDWRELMDQTIQAMEAETSDKPKTAEELSQQARLRMLYALAGRRNDAAKPIPSAPPAMQDFWAKELYGLSVLLDTERTPDAMARAAEAKQHLSEGYTRLGEMAPLLVRNLSFCTVVQSYGCYKPFKNYEFLPNQEVLLYAEVENFGIESTAQGYHTSLRSSYQILDRGGQRIADHAISTTEEHCQNPRRDFFIGYQLRMPSRINPGKYTLQLTIEDLKSQKVGQASVELTIKGGENEKAER